MSEKTAENNKPVATIRDGALKASVWQNTGQNGTFHSVRITRTYKDSEGQYQDSTSFNKDDLLALAHLAKRVYDELAIAQGDQE